MEREGWVLIFDDDGMVSKILEHFMWMDSVYRDYNCQFCNRGFHKEENKNRHENYCLENKDKKTSDECEQV